MLSSKAETAYRSKQQQLNRGIVTAFINAHASPPLRWTPGFRCCHRPAAFEGTRRQCRRSGCDEHQLGVVLMLPASFLLPIIKSLNNENIDSLSAGTLCGAVGLAVGYGIGRIRK